MNLTLFPKQEEFFNADNRINLFSGGIQSSKTTTGALRFLCHGLLRYQEPDDNFLIAADTYKTLSQATIPTFKKFCGPFGKMNNSTAEFKLHKGGTVFFRTGTHPDSAEGIPKVRRVWLDEGGKCSLYFWENLMGRAAPLEAPVDITSTPYFQNWMAELGLAAKAGKRTDVTLIHCKSKESPYFSTKEYERQKALLDPRRFQMKYDGEFGQMQGLVYDLFETCLTDSFELPEGTEYFAGVDWGYYPDPFALVVRALTPDKKHYRVAEYYANYKTISDIIQVVRSFNSLYHFKLTVCDPSQPAHIEELNRQGISAIGGKNDIRYGIDKHYELMRSGRYFVFQDMCPIGRDEYSMYHYAEERELKVDEGYREKDRVPVDRFNHGLDAERYLSVYLLENQVEKVKPIYQGEKEKRVYSLKDEIQRLKVQHRRYSGL